MHKERLGECYTLCIKTFTTKLTDIICSKPAITVYVALDLPAFLVSEVIFSDEGLETLVEVNGVKVHCLQALHTLMFHWLRTRRGGGGGGGEKMN